MSKRSEPTFATTHEVRDTCVCLQVHRTARALARRYDEALRPAGLTYGQFSLLISLNRAEPPSVGDIAALLVMDRTTVTANLKPLERRGLVRVTTDETDRRSRRMTLTAGGRKILAAALPLWRREQAVTARLIGGSSPDRLRADLRSLS